MFGVSLSYGNFSGKLQKGLWKKVLRLAPGWMKAAIS
jgi:hypothetical protein